MVLPRFVVLQSKNNNKYLEYVTEEGEIHGFIRYSGEAIVSPYNKMELQAASKAASFYHIRCAYNNKYWVRQSQTSNYIVAAASEPEEDQSKWSCTLFQPLHDASTDAYRFRHVQLGNNACMWRTGKPRADCVKADYSTPDKDLCDLSAVTDWQTLCILPKYVTFKQGAYLKCYDYEDNLYLQFGASQATDELAGHEVFPQNDGTIRIKSTHWNFWRRDPDWIKADSSDVVNPNTLFRPVKVEGNFVTLRNLGNNRLCKRLTLDDKENCLNAATQSVDDLSKMEVGEYVKSREIYDVQYHTNDARIYDMKILTMASNEATNNTPEENEFTISLDYETSRTSSWDTTIGMTIGVSMTVSAGVPLVAESEITVSTEFSSEYAWGKSETKTESVGNSVAVTVPGMSKRRASVMASQVCCDIPFSYTQRDTLPNGEVVTLRKHDGLYNVVNQYAFHTEIDVARSL